MDRFKAPTLREEERDARIERAIEDEDAFVTFIQQRARRYAMLGYERGIEPDPYELRIEDVGAKIMDMLREDYHNDFVDWCYEQEWED